MKVLENLHFCLPKRFNMPIFKDIGISFEVVCLKLKMCLNSVKNWPGISILHQNTCVCKQSEKNPDFGF